MPFAGVYAGEAKPGAEIRLAHVVRPLTDVERRWWEAYDRHEVPFRSHPLYGEVRTKLHMGRLRARRYLYWRRRNAGTTVDLGPVRRKRGLRWQLESLLPKSIAGMLPPIYVVTNAGVAFLVDDWDNDATDQTTFNFHGYGTGAVAEAVGDTVLGTEVETPRGAGTKSQPSANQLRTVQTHTFAATFAITEHGIFSASTGGTLWDRSVFSAINVVNGDAIQATYTCTVNAGG